MRTFDEDRSERYPLRWFVDGRVVGLDPAAGQPLLLGGDGLGRDLLSRLLLGARTTLGVALLAAVGAVLIGVLIGGVAGYAGGIVDETLMRLADLVLVLPTIYAVLALLSATRTSETLLATWNEVNLSTQTWTMPGERMKAGVEHRVPLAPRCVEILTETQALADGSHYVFPGRSGTKPLSGMAFLMTLRRPVEISDPAGDSPAAKRRRARPDSRPGAPTRWPAGQSQGLRRTIQSRPNRGWHRHVLAANHPNVDPFHRPTNGGSSRPPGPWRGPRSTGLHSQPVTS